MVDDRFAVGPVCTGIEVDRKIVVHDHRGRARGHVDSPVGVNDSTHKALDFLKRSTSEFVVVSSNPSGLGVRVDNLNVGGEINGDLFLEGQKDIEFFAKLNVFASLLGLGEVDEISLVGKEVDAFLELGELLVEGVELLVLIVGGKLDDGFAKFADVVVLSEELVDFASGGGGGQKGEGERAHIFVRNLYYYNSLRTY